MGKIGLLLILTGLSFLSQAQEKKDSVTIEPIDTTLVDKSRPIDTIRSVANRFDPRKALLYAAILPGSGQIYNKKYWKVPLVYGGFWGLIYAANYYQTAYTQYKNELFMTINDPTAIPPSGYTEAQLRTIVDSAKRQRDYMLILTGLLYILQMVDAHVDAHLKEFDLNPKLKAQVQPMSTYDVMMGRSSGVKLVIKF